MIWSKKLLKKCFLLMLTLLAFICVLRLFVVRPLNASWVSGTKKATKNEFKLNNLTADCKRIIDGDSKEISRVEQEMKKVPKRAITCEDYINFSKDCESFQKRRGYILRALNKNEEDFPIAFSVIIYKDIEQFERLLRAIYRPQNSYCIHVDRKSPDILHRAVQRISACFPNVFLASTLLAVRWGEFSVLEADLICMRDLWRRYKNWKYFINLTGQEFPLRTNNELVEILKSLNGKSIIKGSKPTKRSILNRFHYVHRGTKPTNITKIPFGYNFTLFKGSTHVAVSRSFVNFTLHSHMANEFLDWVKDTGVPDETFLPSLFANVNFLSSRSLDYRGKGIHWRWDTRYKNWGKFPCHGKVVRRICINGLGDLRLITTRSELFVNKFHLEYQYIALDCLEQWLYNKTLVDYKRAEN